MWRFVRGLHTSCRILEAAASAPSKAAGKKVSPQSLGFTRIGGSRERILPDLTPNASTQGQRQARSAGNNRPRERRPRDGNRQNERPRQTAEASEASEATEGSETSAPREARPRRANVNAGLDAVPTEFFEGVFHAAPETRDPSTRPKRAPGGARNRPPPVCYNCQETGHMSSACPNPRVARPPRARTASSGGSGAGAKKRAPRPQVAGQSGRPAKLEESTSKFRESGGPRHDVQPLTYQAMAIVKETNGKVSPTSPHALFGRQSLLRPPSTEDESAWWAKGMDRPEVSKTLALRRAGDYSSQVLPNPLNGSKIQRAAYVVSMNKSVDPTKRSEFEEVLKQYLN